MKQQERQKKSKEKILQAAITEFSASGYDKVTMENICTRHGISKGMMYHYYSGKDDLFLLCVQNMYQMMQQYLEENMAELEKKDALHALKEFWMLRESFFGEHPGIGILETGGTVPKRTADFGRSFADGGSRRIVGYGAVGGCAAKLMLAKTN